MAEAEEAASGTERCGVVMWKASARTQARRPDWRGARLPESRRKTQAGGGRTGGPGERAIACVCLGWLASFPRLIIVEYYNITLIVIARLLLWGLPTGRAFRTASSCLLVGKGRPRGSLRPSCAPLASSPSWPSPLPYPCYYPHPPPS